MKRITILSTLIMIMLTLGSNSFATVWRVCSAPGSAAHYSTIQAAHDAGTTLNGDTLYIESAAGSVGPLSCYKKLIIIGSGYFLGENPQTQASPVSSSIDYVYFYQGSEGSKIAGCTLSYIYIYCSDLLITRNRINNYSGAINQATSNNIGNIVITQNFIGLQGYYYYNSINFSYPANNILVSNNIIFGGIYTGTNFYGIFTNNCIDGSLTVYNSTFKNNIMWDGSNGTTNCNFTNNIGTGTQFGNQNNNQENVSLASLFVGATGNSTDGQYMLKPGSPAIGAGEGGVDCGAFGGTNPYVLSGMPNIPAIYYFNAPSMPSNTINVSIKAKSHN